MSKIFKMKSDIEFEADDIMDAFDKLAEHFNNISNGDESDLIIGGEIEIEPLTRGKNE